MGCLPLNQLNMMTVDEDNTHSAVSAAEELLRRTSYFPDYVATVTFVATPPLLT